jgi:CDP-glycerol glycerophosphotransferase
MEDSVLGINLDQTAIARMRVARARGWRVGLYAPTFRKNLLNPFEQGLADLDSLSRCAKRNNLLLVFKLHPAMKGLQGAADLEHIIEYDSRADVYPALVLTDFLVTDYSSIYFDYLLLDRPILFFPFDYETYVSQDRSLLFDYEAMTPGPKYRNQQDLETALEKLCRQNADGYAEARRKIRELVFSRRDDGAAHRIWTHLLEHRLVRAGRTR